MENREPGIENGERANWLGVSFAASEFPVLHSRFSILFSWLDPAPSGQGEALQVCQSPVASCKARRAVRVTSVVTAMVANNPRSRTA